MSRPLEGGDSLPQTPSSGIDTFKGSLKLSGPMAPGSEGLRGDLERIMTTLDRAPHTHEELARETGIPDPHLEPRIETLLDRGYISRWGGGDAPVLALTWPGRYRIQPRRFQAAALASLAAGLAAAAGLTAWAAGTAPSTPGPGPEGAAVGLAVASLAVLAAAALRRTGP